MEEEARLVLSSALAEEDRPHNLVESIRRLIEPLGGVELEPLPRHPVRRPPKF